MPKVSYDRYGPARDGPYSRPGMSASPYRSRRPLPAHLSRDRDTEPRRDSDCSAIDQLTATLSSYQISPAMTKNFLSQVKVLGASSHIGSVSCRSDIGDTTTGWKDYRLGDIVCIPHVAPSLDPKANLGERHFVNSLTTGGVVTKTRPAVVVAMYERYMTCLPMYTSSGNGFRHQPLSVQDDCIYLLTANRSPKEPFPGTNATDEVAPMDRDSSNVLLTSPSFKSRGESYVNLTQGYVVHYAYPIRLLGRMLPVHTEELLNLWLESNEKGHMPVDRQSGRYTRIAEDFRLMRTRYEKQKLAGNNVKKEAAKPRVTEDIRRQPKAEGWNDGWNFDQSGIRTSKPDGADPKMSDLSDGELEPGEIEGEYVLW